MLTLGQHRGLLSGVTGGPVAAALIFTQQPSDSSAGVAIDPPVEISVSDSEFQPIPSFTGNVTMACAPARNRAVFVGFTAASFVTGAAGLAFEVTTLISAVETRIAFWFSVDGVETEPSTGADLYVEVPLVTGNTAAQCASALRTAANPYFDTAKSSGSSVIMEDFTSGLRAAAADVDTGLAITFRQGGTLSGTLTVAAVAGVATFGNISVADAATVALRASIETPALDADSNTFEVT
jgi:hypothetical protein